MVDANHPWAGQTLELEVTLLGFLEPQEDDPWQEDGGEA